MSLLDTSGYPLSWLIDDGLGGRYSLPCRLTGRLDRTVTGRLHGGKSVEIELPGGYRVWTTHQALWWGLTERMTEQDVICRVDLMSLEGR